MPSRQPNPRSWSTATWEGHPKPSLLPISLQPCTKSLIFPSDSSPYSILMWRRKSSVAAEERWRRLATSEGSLKPTSVRRRLNGVAAEARGGEGSAVEAGGGGEGVRMSRIGGREEEGAASSFGGFCETALFLATPNAVERRHFLDGGAGVSDLRGETGEGGATSTGPGAPCGS